MTGVYNFMKQFNKSKELLCISCGEPINDSTISSVRCHKPHCPWDYHIVCSCGYENNMAKLTGVDCRCESNEEAVALELYTKHPILRFAQCDTCSEIMELSERGIEMIDQRLLLGCHEEGCMGVLKSIKTPLG